MYVFANTDNNPGPRCILFDWKARKAISAYIYIYIYMACLHTSKERPIYPGQFRSILFYTCHCQRCLIYQLYIYIWYSWSRWRETPVDPRTSFFLLLPGQSLAFNCCLTGRWRTTTCHPTLEVKRMWSHRLQDDIWSSHFCSNDVKLSNSPKTLTANSTSFSEQQWLLKLARANLFRFKSFFLYDSWPRRLGWSSVSCSADFASTNDSRKTLPANKYRSS